MESPPSSTTWSGACLLSDDSGLLLTNSSLSSNSISGLHPVHLEDSDCSERSLSQYSLDAMSDIICNSHFNTLKKTPHYHSPLHASYSPISPPLQFRDRPLDAYITNLASRILRRALEDYHIYQSQRKPRPLPAYRPVHPLLFSPCHARPASRSSLSSRLSSSHNSLSVSAHRRVDDSSFITQAVSHDTLSTNHVQDFYDSEVYAVPVDVVKAPSKPKRNNKRRRRNTAEGGGKEGERGWRSRKTPLRSDRYPWCEPREPKRHSLAGSSDPSREAEPIHMTLQEVRTYLQTLYSGSSDSDHRERASKTRPADRCTQTNEVKKSTFLVSIKTKKVKDSCENLGRQLPHREKRKKVQRFFSFKQALCNMFRFRRFLSPERVKCETKDAKEEVQHISSRALPPLPKEGEVVEVSSLDFATSIQRVKDYGWYWGPLSSEVAEKILSNEPDGSFIVRDSSDDHYIFSLTFKLNSCVRHVRIDHDQGNFSFGGCTKFKSQTIVEFIENAVEHSRSGRYLFFLHRRPVIGPVRVQLLHPVSRFKQVQSLQHMCRFAIHKVVRRDLIPSLPLPRRIIDYLNTPHYYSEHLIDVEETSLPPEPTLNYVLVNDTRQS